MLFSYWYEENMFFFQFINQFKNIFESNIPHCEEFTFGNRWLGTHWASISIYTFFVIFFHLRWNCNCTRLEYLLWCWMTPHHTTPHHTSPFDTTPQYRIDNFSNLRKKWWFFQILARIDDFFMMIFQNLTKINDF